MLIIINKKIPEEAKKALQKYGDLMELETTGITYDAISGHPDIFFCQDGDLLVVAPNLPEDYLKKLDQHRINYHLGEKLVGIQYPDSACYNAVAGSGFFIHNLEATDKTLFFSVWDKEHIHVNQGYTRCNLLLLKDNFCLTSDPGIRQALENRFSVLFVPPDNIVLPGFDHGFIGGTCGIYKDTVFFAGSLNYISNGREVHDLLVQLNYKIIELYDGPLFDGGSILFVEFSTSNTQH